MSEPVVARLRRRLPGLLVFAVGAAAGLLVLYLVLPLLPEPRRAQAPQPAVVSEPPVAPAGTSARPSAAPERIPQWAWELHRWHSTPPPERDVRPAAAPARVPAWYWAWRKWRMQLAG